MYVVTVIPLRKGITIDALSYFSADAYPPGTIVSIPVRERTVLGLITESREVSAAKTALRAATFSLRKLPTQAKTTVLGDAFRKTAEDLSRHYASPVGTILYNLLPPEIRNGELPLPHTHHVTKETAHPIEVFEARADERHRAYRSLVRETFAHSGSVLFVAPSSFEAGRLRAALEPGIEDRIIMLTTAQTKTELRKSFAALEDFARTKLIIATPSYAMVERHDITHVVLEHARSPYYRELTRPYLDYRDVLIAHAKHTGRATILADLLPRAEEEDLRRREVYQTYGETPKRIELPGKLETIDMTRKEGDTLPFRLFDDRVLDAVRDVRKRRGRVFLFAARRGLAPLVACMDCGYIFRSKESGAPYSLLRTVKDGVEKRWFVSSSSGERIPAAETCAGCGSWRLRERGIGIQQVYDELHKLLPSVPITLFDHESARTYKKATFLRDTFYATKGGVLLGTQMALPYLTDPVDLSVVVNMDALLATPTWRLDEENLALLLSLREVTRGTVYIQTRTEKADILAHAKQGSVESFYTEELELRKSFGYPPYTTFIHLTWQGTPEVVKKLEAEVRRVLKDHPISLYPAPAAAASAPIMYGLIRLERGAWPDPKLAGALRALPPPIRVVINPDRIV